MQIRIHAEVTAPIDKVWEVLGEGFGHFDQWSTALTSSKLSGELRAGAIRTCHAQKVGPFPPAIVKERLVDFNRQQKRYTYIVESGLPSIFKKAQNTWTVEAIDEKNSIIRSHVVAELVFWLRPFNWLFTLLFKRDIKKFFEEMIYFIEHEKIHPRKEESLLQPNKS
ncbi:SRPBCC family protein [Marinicella sp. W31]|uniref:SRPBCC family protein n=1 Tax=Marinicella sp. W31 TaxID=3023713 RepID=UPI0037566672